MKKAILTFLCVANATALFAAAAESPQPASPKPEKQPMINSELALGFGFPFAGKQVQIARDSLTPTPDYYVNYVYGGRVIVMPSRFGFEAGFHRGLFRAASLKGGGYSIYTYDIAHAGAVYSMPLSSGSSSGSRTFLTFGAGVNYTMLQYADKFKSDLQTSASKQGLILVFHTDPATGIGGYGQIGIMLYFTDHLFLTAVGRVAYTSAKFSGGSTTLDGWAFEMPFGIGVGF